MSTVRSYERAKSNSDPMMKETLHIFLPKRTNSKMGSYEKRAKNTTNPVMRKLLNIMLSKCTNLCVDVERKYTTMSDLLDLISLVGPHICILRLYILQVWDFSKDFIRKLQSSATHYNFLLFESDTFFEDDEFDLAQLYGFGRHRIAR